MSSRCLISLFLFLFIIYKDGINGRKTKEELNVLKKEYEELINKLHDLTEEEVKQVTGGEYCPYNTVMECQDCGYTYLWDGDYVGRVFGCPECGRWKFRGIKLVNK